MDKIENNSKHFLYIAAAIIFAHILTLYQQVSLNVSDFKSEEDEKIVIKLVNLPQATSKPVVKTVKAKKKRVEDAFRGKDDNFVYRETRATESGVTKDAGAGRKDGNAKVSALQKLQMPKVKIETDLSKLSLLKANKKTQKKNKKKNQKSQIAKGISYGNKASTGIAKSSQALDDIPLGDLNALNTSKYKNYAYNMRVRDKIEQLWFRAINNAVSSIGNRGRYLASEVHRTSLKIILDAKGKIKDVTVMGASGVKEFDESAIKSFNEAVAFPNPPKDMIKNGQVVLNWSFNVDASR